MTGIKICGLTRSEDIEYVNALMPEYIGFVFAKSKRMVSVDKASELARMLKPGIKKVGVFVDEPSQSVMDIARVCGLDVLQLHGSEDVAYCKGLKGYEVWKSFGVGDAESLNEIEKYKGFGILLDTSYKGQCGGTGRTFDWSRAKGISDRFFTILAGGITPENVKEAIEIVRPHVVDVSSGVETDGVKDFEKIKKLIENVRG